MIVSAYRELNNVRYSIGEYQILQVKHNEAESDWFFCQVESPLKQLKSCGEIFADDGQWAGIMAQDVSGVGYQGRIPGRLLYVLEIGNEGIWDIFEMAPANVARLLHFVQQREWTITQGVNTFWQQWETGHGIDTELVLRAAHECMMYCLGSRRKQTPGDPA